MGSFKIVEDRPTPKEVYNFRIYFFATVASCGAVVFGYDGAFFGTTLARASFRDAFGISTMTKAQQTANSANLSASYLAAAFFGAFFAWPMMEIYGRRITCRIAAVYFTIGAILMTAAQGQLSMIYAGRVITGMGAGSITAVLPTYIAELSPPAIRGQLTGLFECAYQAGSLIGFWINYGVNTTMDVHSSASWRVPMAIQIPPAALLALGTFFICESPFHLFRKGREEQALKNLTYLRQLDVDHSYIQEEIIMARARLEEELEMSQGRTGIKAFVVGAYKELRIKHMRHRLIITFGMFLLQNWSGALVINYYSPTLFRTIGVSDVALYTGVYGLVKALGSFIFFLFIVDRSGRRVPWLISATAGGLCLLYLSIFIKKADFTPPLSASTKTGGQVALASVMLYSLFWSFGGNGLPWVVSAEIFPSRVRSLTGAFSAMSCWLGSFSSTEAFPYMIASGLGVWGSFLFFSVCCFLTTAFTFVWIPETKAISIEAMETLFSGPVRHAAWRQKAIYPPHGLPPLLPALLARETRLMEADNVREGEKMPTEIVEHIESSTINRV